MMTRSKCSHDQLLVSVDYNLVHRNEDMLVAIQMWRSSIVSIRKRNAKR